MRRADRIVEDIKNDLDVSEVYVGDEGYKIAVGVEAFGWGGPSRQLVLETLSNALDTVQDGDDWRDIEIRLESQGAEYIETSLTVDEAIEMVGVLYNHSYEPSYLTSMGHEPLQAILDAWLYEMAEDVMNALVRYLKEQAGEA